MKMLRSIIIFLVSVSLSLPSFCLATDDVVLIDKAKAIEAAAAVTKEKYPNADDVLIDDYTKVQYNPDGSAVELCDSYQKVLTESGRRGASTITLQFTIPYDAVEVLMLEVIKLSGEIVPVDIKAQSKEMISSSQMNQNIYNPNDKELRVGIPNLEIGDTIHSITRQKTLRSIVPNTWSSIVLFEYTSPILHHTYEVLSPKGRPLQGSILKNKIGDTVKETVNDTPEGKRYVWEVNNVPQLFPEPDMPSLAASAQRLILSTAKNWEEISKWYWNVSLPHLEAVTPEMRAKVEELIKDATDERSKIEAIFRFVSQEIRYMGITIETEAPGFEPHDVKLTFEQKHGVCRDKAALLASMLRLADINAYPTLIYVGPKRDPEVALSYFNHAIVAVETKDKETILMDPTNESTKDLFPAYLSNRSYLIAKKNGDTLHTSPITPAEENSFDVKTYAKIDAKGRLTATSKLTFNGINDSAYRGHFAKLSVDERKRFFEYVAKAISENAEVLAIDIRPHNLLDTNTTLSAELTYSADDVLIQNDKTAILVPPYLSNRLGVVNFSLDKTGLEKRKYPLLLDFASSSTEEIDLKLDPHLGDSIYIPDFTEVKHDIIESKTTINQIEQGMQIKRNFAIKNIEISPEQYLELKQDLKKIEVNARKLPIIERSPISTKGADLLLEKRVINTTLKDIHTWEEDHYYKTKILTYKGKKDYSEIKLSYNTEQEEIEVVQATVKNGDKVHQIQKNEINIMDAAWVASAPRYPAEKTLVISLPGVEIGSEIEVKLHKKKFNQPFFYQTALFRDFNPLASKEVTIDSPIKLKFLGDHNGIFNPDVAEQSDLKYEEKEENSRYIYTIETANQPAIKAEDQLPALFIFAPMANLSAGDWSKYSKELLEKLKAAAQDQKAAENLAKNLTSNAKDDYEKFITIRDFVVKNIRRAGPNLTKLPLSAISAADTTLKDGYGNSTDRAVLLYTMLHTLGYSPEFVLSTASILDDATLDYYKSHPSPFLFTQILVRVNDIYLNDTNQYAKLGTTSADKQLILNLSDASLSILKISDELQDKTESSYKVTLTADGKATFKVIRKSYGTIYEAEKMRFEEMTPEERDRYHQNQVAAISQNAKQSGELITDFERYPGMEAFSVEIDNFAVINADYMYFKLPSSLYHIFSTVTESRESPLFLSEESYSSTKTIINLPKEFSNIRLIPEAGTWQLPHKAGEISLEIQQSANELTLERTINLHPAILSEAEYQELRSLNKVLSHPRSTIVLLQKEDTKVDKE